jgi:uncharacterized protein (DUF1810 family)
MAHPAPWRRVGPTWLWRAIVTPGRAPRRCRTVRSLQAWNDNLESQIEMSETASRLQRFKDAQDQHVSGFESALSEIREGGKRSHWIWYVFPQLSGLGHSAASQIYGLDGVAEAEEYLRDPLLRSRLLTIATAVAEKVGAQASVSLERLMGSSIDATKLVSSMTLFKTVATRLHATAGLDEYASIASMAERILSAAAAEGYPPCQFTRKEMTSLSGTGLSAFPRLRGS